MWLRFSLSAHTEFTHSNSVQVRCSTGCLDEHTLLSLGQKGGVLGWRGQQSLGEGTTRQKTQQKVKAHRMVWVGRILKIIYLQHPAMSTLLIRILIPSSFLQRYG